MFNLSFTTESLAELVRLVGFSALLDEDITDAFIDIGETVTQAAQANALSVFIRNDPGGLADSIYPWLTSPTQMEIRVGVAWGQRREYGFSGMTDSLGRYYPYDPGKPYLTPALEENEDWITERTARAVTSMWTRVGGGANA